jgi:hypothetical protein
MPVVVSPETLSYICILVNLLEGFNNKQNEEFRTLMSRTNPAALHSEGKRSQ